MDDRQGWLGINQFHTVASIPHIPVGQVRQASRNLRRLPESTTAWMQEVGQRRSSCREARDGFYADWMPSFPDGMTFNTVTKGR